MRKYLRYITYALVLIASFAAKADPAVDFFRAVGVDNSLTVRELLSQGFNPNTTDPRGQVGLYLALREHSFKVAELLLEQPGIAYDAVNPAGETPLMMAALRGETDWVRKLIDRGARINRQGWTPLHYAASGPEPEVVRLLLEHGAAIDAPSPNQTTPLMMAARYGREESVSILLAHGADPRQRNIQGLDAAAFARLGGRDKLAARLAEAAAGKP
ncbi:MAG: ankyrin repeat domain-containing protein [Burkholderiales bacterium]|nr:ankyrin repeat domain-containing protein [Burkholderiales bacterium]MDE1927076.1 ankyrin repeat domain-containing protein [Burkholderiales bacterium]MDE2160138.1 ankyrin repeat domain-containing protein [Burkholderiales bacterium]MDE2504672.1 ankyrin repeat domain-containing protein [Burkholderiales bacterium]